MRIALACFLAFFASSVGAVPYAGIGQTSCAEFVANDGYKDRPEYLQIHEWAAGLATGLNIQRQLMGNVPIDLTQFQGGDLMEDITLFCEENPDGNVTQAVVIMLIPALKTQMEKEK